jgi:uncharacterized lipoprotein NlpE involved in copper resistance
MKRLILPIGLILACLVGCNDKSSTDEQESVVDVSKYVFAGENDVLHVREYCRALRNYTDENGHAAYGKYYIDTLQFLTDNGYTYCTKCVTHRSYEHLQAILKRNQKSFGRYIFNEMVKADYDMESYELFCQQIRNDVKRKRLYDAVVEEGFFDDTYETFSEFLGIY